jgi:hypothetical protein
MNLDFGGRSNVGSISGYNSGIGSVVACPIDILIGQETANCPSNMSSGNATTLQRYHARDVNR